MANAHHEKRDIKHLPLPGEVLDIHHFDIIKPSSTNGYGRQDRWSCLWREWTGAKRETYSGPAEVPEFRVRAAFQNIGIQRALPDFAGTGSVFFLATCRWTNAPGQPVLRGQDIWCINPIFTTCTGQAIVNAQINKIFLDVLNPGSWKSA